jgi:hypothetical protein
MNKRLLMSVAAAALIAGTGFANAQGAGGAGRESGGAGGAGAAAHSAPAGGAADRAAPGGAGDRAAGGAAAGAGDRSSQTERNAPANKDEATDTTNRSDQRQDQKAQSDDKMQRDNSRNATDSTRDNGKANKDANNADGKNPNAKSAADDKGMNKEATTGQAGAGAKLNGEQRTKVTSVIKQQNIKPVTNVNFSISVGTRVPRDVEFHPLPAEIVTVYPDWRGYDFILVNDQILVINPRSYEIVAVIDA